ncbi:hypothetical protein ACTXT7_009040 [Hymenolepis weldensis]
MTDKVKAFTKAEELVLVQLILEISSFLINYLNEMPTFELIGENENFKITVNSFPVTDTTLTRLFTV